VHLCVFGTDHGVKVLFTEYGNREEIPYEYLQPVDSTASAAAAAADTSAGMLYVKIYTYLFLKILHMFNSWMMNVTMIIIIASTAAASLIYVLTRHRSRGVLQFVSKAF
jgi:hypothetical protein